MSKEEALQALRETNIRGFVRPPVRPIGDVEVVKYLDTLRRKATTVDDVNIIDAIMKGLFNEGMNKVTGRVHGERVQDLSGGGPLANRDEAALAGETSSRGSTSVANGQVASPTDPPEKFDKKAYQREYMRKKRAKEA